MTRTPLQALDADEAVLFRKWLDRYVERLIWDVLLKTFLDRVMDDWDADGECFRSRGAREHVHMMFRESRLPVSKQEELLALWRLSGG